MHTPYHQNAQFVMQTFRRLGLNPRASSRIELMYSAFFDREGNVRTLSGPGSDNFDAAKESVREFNLLGYTLEVLLKNYSRIELATMLDLVLHDSLRPQDDRTISKGRDKQFELYVLATCLAGGLSPAKLEEPDITCHFDWEKFVIAVKRAKSFKQLEKRIREGARQCTQSLAFGIVAVETSLAFNPDGDHFLTPMSDEEFGNLYIKEFQEFVRANFARIRAWANKPNVLGVILHHEILRLPLEGGWKLEGMTYPICISDSAPKAELFTRFALAYSGGLPNQHDFGVVTN